MGVSDGAKGSKVPKEDDEFIVITSELYKSSNNRTYIIKKLSEVKHKKLKGLFLFNQCTLNDSQKFFFELESLSEYSLIYYFTLSSKIPILKTYSEIETFQPFKDPTFNKIIILSTLSSNNDNISNSEISKSIQEKGGFKFDMVLDFSKSEENLSQMEKNIKHNMIISISSVGFEENKLDPENKNETFKITGNLNNDSILIIIKWLFNGNTPKINNDNSDIINDQIKHIMIKNAIINDINSFKQLINLLKCFPIQLLTFCENTVNNEIKWWEHISELLKNHYSIKYIDFHSQNITDDIISVLIKSILDKNITIMDLGGNNITYKGCEKIGEYLKTCPRTEKLYFRNNSNLLFKKDGVKLITEGLANNDNIEFLEFSNMEITGCGEHLDKIIKNKSNFKYLFLKNCKLNCKDFKYIFEEIEKSESIKEVDVSDNNMGGNKALEYIAKAIKNNKSLNYLGMNNIGLNMDNYELIFNAINFNIGISNYSLSYNSGLKPKVVFNFFIKLSHIKYLEYIPYGPLDNGKELTLEEKKIIEQIKNTRKDLEFIYKEKKE